MVATPLPIVECITPAPAAFALPVLFVACIAPVPAATFAFYRGTSPRNRCQSKDQPLNLFRRSPGCFSAVLVITVLSDVLAHDSAALAIHDTAVGFDLRSIRFHLDTTDGFALRSIRLYLDTTDDAALQSIRFGHDPSMVRRAKLFSFGVSGV